MLCILSALLGCQGMGEYQNMLHAALNMGIDPVAVKEVVYQATAYLGIGRIHDFLIVTNQIMGQMRIHGLTRGLRNRLNCSGRIWRRDRRKGPFFAEISTAGWRITVSAIIIPGTA